MRYKIDEVYEMVIPQEELEVLIEGYVRTGWRACIKSGTLYAELGNPVSFDIRETGVSIEVHREFNYYKEFYVKDIRLERRERDGIVVINKILTVEVRKYVRRDEY